MSIKLKPLAEQVIVITGASSGIGLVIARTAAKAGAAVFLIARSGEVLDEVCREINNAGGRADFAAADVGDAAKVEAAAAAAVARFGRIDAWVNDAGSAIYGKVLDTPLDEQAQLFRTNYFGVVHGCRAAVPHLRMAGGGAIVTVGSLASDMPSAADGGLFGDQARREGVRRGAADGVAGRRRADLDHAGQAVRYRHADRSACVQSRRRGRGGGGRGADPAARL